MNDHYPQYRFWKAFQQIVFDCYYYERYSHFFAMISRGINIIISIITIIATGVLVTWSQSKVLQIICPSAIGILQILRLSVDQFNFDAKERKLRNAYNRSKEIQTAAEKVWGCMVEGVATKPEIINAFYYILQHRDKIASECLEEIYLPEKKSIIEKAETKATAYILGIEEDIKGGGKENEES